MDLPFISDLSRDLQNHSSFYLISYLLLLSNKIKLILNFQNFSLLLLKPLNWYSSFL